MSKLAHSNDETMLGIDANKIVQHNFPTALTVIKAIAVSDHLKGHEDYLTKTQIVALCKAFLRQRRLGGKEGDR